MHEPKGLAEVREGELIEKGCLLWLNPTLQVSGDVSIL